MTLLERINLSGNLQPCENNIPWVNRNFLIIDSLMQTSILGFVDEQPLGASIQDVYALIQDPLGPVITPKLIISTGNNTWISIEAKAGFRVFNQADGLFYYFDGTDWIQEHIDGNDVEGPALSTDNAIARFDGVTGKLIQNSGVIIDDDDNMTGVDSLYTNNLIASYEEVDKSYLGNLTGVQSGIYDGPAGVLPLESMFNFLSINVSEITTFVLPTGVDESSVLYLENNSGDLCFIRNSLSIKTPTGGDYQFETNTAITIIYSKENDRFYIIAGGGASGSGSVVVADLTARDAIPSYERYIGLNVFVESEEWNYQLRGGITNANWTDGGNPTYIYAADSAARFAISTTIRRHGLIAYQQDEEQLWILGAGLTNGDWYRQGDMGSSDGDDVGEIFASVRRHDDAPIDTLYCGGSSHDAADFPELALKLWDTTTSKWKYGGTGTYPTGTFNTPNLLGRVLRGVANGSTVDPDRASRVALMTNGNIGDNVGSAQSWATRAPNTAFTVNTTGAHTHNMTVSNTGGGAGVSVGDGSNIGPSSTSTTSNGNHTHTVTGGDAETRMTNVYVNYFIRTKPSKVGKRGGVLHTGSADPNTLTFTPPAMLGDIYIRSNGDVWEHNGTVWVVTATNIRGPQGIQGGILSVADNAERDAIAPLDRYEGMPVFVRSTNKNYQLVDGITNSDWKEFAGDTSMTVSANQSLAGVATISDVREQRIKVSGVSAGSVFTLPNGYRDGDKLWIAGTSDALPAVLQNTGNVLAPGGSITFTNGLKVIAIWDNTDSHWYI